MPNHSREARPDTVQILLPWGIPTEAREEFGATAAWWASGGAVLLLWTAIAFLLTGA